MHTSVSQLYYDMVTLIQFHKNTLMEWYNRQHIVTILSMIEKPSISLQLTMLTGRVDCSILYFCLTSFHMNADT